MEIIQNQTLTSIQSNTKYLGCVFFLSESYRANIAIFDNCHFENCSFRDGFKFHGGKNCVFIDCNYSNGAHLYARDCADIAKSYGDYENTLKFIDTISIESYSSIQEKILKLPEQFEQLQNIKKVYLSGSAIKSLPDFIFALTSLETLAMTNVGFSLPKKIKRLENLKHLEWFKSGVIGNSRVPKELYELSNLLTLSISTETLRSLSPNINELKKLKVLKLKCRALDKLPTELYELVSLEVLSIKSDGLAFISPKISKLKQLRELKLDCSMLQTLPVEIGQLTNLGVLNIESCPIKALPSSCQHLKKLTHFTVRGQLWQEIPDYVFTFKSLKQLTITHSHIINISDKIRYLKNLECLRLQANQITEIPEAVFELTKLQRLDFFNNSIDSVPDSISQLTALKLLDIGSNPLVFLSDEIRKLPNLRCLKIKAVKLEEEHIDQLKDYPESINIQLKGQEELLLEQMRQNKPIPNQRIIM